ncbi:hypothetical protein K501DRAFT_174301 [Backusella circina FSU 941]|nr:hypothetical protein K501DRAFT_174301 [Backusella circina FSU 941]
MKSLSIIALTCLAAVHAANVEFKVLVPDATESVEVSINGANFPLARIDQDLPLFVGSADLPEGQTYNYVSDGVPESFTRTHSAGDSTYNELFGRPISYADIPEIPKVLSEGAWDRAFMDHELWDNNYIHSVFVTADPDEMENLITNVPKTVYNAKISFVGPREVTTFEDCAFGLHRPGRRNNDAKQSWVWALPEGQFYAKRNWFKARHQEEDPTQLREKLYADISRSMGTYAGAANMIRIYINNESVGTFNVLDDVSKYSYIRAMFYNGTAPGEMGGLFDGMTGSSFVYDKSGDAFNNFLVNADSPVGAEAMEPFTRQFDGVDMSDPAEVEAISSYFDVDQYIRFMVMEFLTGNWDGYWQEQSNDGAYLDPFDNNKLYYLAQDFDATFGVNLPFGKDFAEISYTEFPDKFPGAILINRLLENPKMKATFEDYLKVTVSDIFNLEVLGPIVQARHEFYSTDLEWDRSIEQRSPGNLFGWTFDQTGQNLVEGVKAHGDRSGGASWGLLEWIDTKSKAVQAEFGITVNNRLNTTRYGHLNKFKNLDDHLTAASLKNPYTGESTNNINVESSARKELPQIISAMAIVAVLSAFF